MNTIATRENALFDRWEKKHEHLFRDGVPVPSSYIKTKIKTVFVLREPNFQGCPRAYDFRIELPDNPHHFWKRKVGLLCYALSSFSDTVDELWKKAQDSEIDATKELLSRFGYVQIRKMGGAGTADHKKLRQYAEEYGALLREQIAIYSPNLVVACGLGTAKTFSLLTEHVLKEHRECQLGRTGRRYAIVNDTELSPSPIYMIETHHPSHRKSRYEVFRDLVSDFRHVAKTHIPSS